MTIYEEWKPEPAGNRRPTLSRSNIYRKLLRLICPWCEQDKLREHKEPTNSLTEVPMCRSVPSYALPKRVLNKEGVYKTVAADPDTKLVEAVRVSRFP